MRTMLLVVAVALVGFLLLISPDPAPGLVGAVGALLLLGYTGSLTIKLTRDSGNLEYTITDDGDGHTERTWTVPDSTSDQLCEIAIDVSQVKTFFIVSTQDVTVETNDGSTPDNTLSLVANEPYIWHVSALDTFQLDTDVTAMYITNASGAEATVYVDVVEDTTP